MLASSLSGRLVTVLAAAIALGAAAPVAAAAPNADDPTFTRDVLPIFQRSCQQCHRPGTGAPMSLLTWEQARPWARAIKDRVATRQMPPWHVDRSIGKFAPDPSLSDAEIAVIAAWVENGAPRGNPADAPPPLALEDLEQWTYGEPDVIVSMVKGFDIPEEGPDFYPSEVVDPGFTEDRYVKWVQMIPSALSIPPNTVARHERFLPLPQDALILSFQPHMHFRGSRMLLEAIHLDGRREVLVDVNNYEQSWQMVYPFEQPHLFPKGTILHSVSWHDNTANNRDNPDPSAWVGWGGRTMDEMGQGWTDIAFMTEEQYRTRLAEREKGQ